MSEGQKSRRLKTAKVGRRMVGEMQLVYKNQTETSMCRRAAVAEGIPVLVCLGDEGTWCRLLPNCAGWGRRLGGEIQAAGTWTWAAGAPFGFDDDTARLQHG